MSKHGIHLPQNLLYRNRENQLVAVTISHHAYMRFLQRWCSLHGAQCPDPEEQVQRMLRGSSRVRKFNRHEVQRLKRYGRDTLYLRNGQFTFVVHNCVIVTVEISATGKRELNQRAGRRHPPLGPLANAGQSLNGNGYWRKHEANH